MYKILPYSYKQATTHGYDIKPSIKKNKKIDVFRNDKRIASIGDPKYSDYPHYILSHGLTYADERRKLYHQRHKMEGLTGKLAKLILW